jgi:excisionase family DNA binding protein
MDDEVGRLTYSVTEAARALGVSRSYCYELVQRGVLPYIALGRRRVIPRKALEDYVERETRQHRYGTTSDDEPRDIVENCE